MIDVHNVHSAWTSHLPHANGSRKCNKRTNINRSHSRTLFVAKLGVSPRKWPWPECVVRLIGLSEQACGHDQSAVPSGRVPSSLVVNALVVLQSARRGGLLVDQRHEVGGCASAEDAIARVHPPIV